MEAMIPHTEFVCVYVGVGFVCVCIGVQVWAA